MPYSEEVAQALGKVKSGDDFCDKDSIHIHLFSETIEQLLELCKIHWTAILRVIYRVRLPVLRVLNMVMEDSTNKTITKDQLSVNRICVFR
jgi:hypothetical protein